MLSCKCCFDVFRTVTYRNCTWGNLKIFGGITLILFLFSFITISELDKLSRQPASRVVILLLLRFLRKEGRKEGRGLSEHREFNEHNGTATSEQSLINRTQDPCKVTWEIWILGYQTKSFSPEESVWAVDFYCTSMFQLEVVNTMSTVIWQDKNYSLSLMAYVPAFWQQQLLFSILFGKIQYRLVGKLSYFKDICSSIEHCCQFKAL